MVPYDVRLCLDDIPELTGVPFSVIRQAGSMPYLWLALQKPLGANPEYLGDVEYIRQRSQLVFYHGDDRIIIMSPTAADVYCSISFGVVYNSARIALSERSRELSSLRVLGYTRGEISYILLGELGLITLIAIPLGFIIGYWLCAYIAQDNA